MKEAGKDVSLNYAQQLLLQLKQGYLEELPSRCDDIENLLLRMASESKGGEVYDEVYRGVHSIKGSAGTHGIPFVSTICHYFEDHLNHLGSGLSTVTPEYINICLRYVDLIRQSIEVELDTSSIDDQLESLRNIYLKQDLVGIMVSDSAYINMLCQNVMSDLPVQLVTVESGLIALERVLHQRFDFLITGKEAKDLNGRALTLAVRASGSRNRDMPIIMLTSKVDSGFPENLAPNYILRKDVSLGDTLHASLQKIVTKR